MGGITVEDFTQSRIYKENVGIGFAEGEARVTLRLLSRRCGPLSADTTAHIEALPLEQLEALAVDAVFSEGVALLDFQGPADLAAWFAALSRIPYSLYRIQETKFLRPVTTSDQQRPIGSA